MSPLDKKLAGQFKSTFRVYWTVFEEIRDLIVERKFHNPGKEVGMDCSEPLEPLSKWQRGHVVPARSRRGTA